jgi:hypothetical protein
MRGPGAALEGELQGSPQQPARESLATKGRRDAEAQDLGLVRREGGEAVGRDLGQRTTGGQAAEDQQLRGVLLERAKEGALVPTAGNRGFLEPAQLGRVVRNGGREPEPLAQTVALRMSAPRR